MSVCPVASQTREPDGTGIIDPAARRSRPAGASGPPRLWPAPGARPTARSRSGPPGRHVGCRRDRGRQGERDEGRWGSRGLLLDQQGAPPSEQQAGVQTVPARATSEAVVAGSSASARMARFLLGRPDAARARNDDVRRVGHRSRHRADTAPSGASTCIQSKALQPQGGLHRALTLFKWFRPLVR